MTVDLKKGALLGVSLGSLLSGAVFAEIVFARPGVGKLIFDAVITRNYPVVLGSVVAGLLNAVLDPRRMTAPALY